MTPAQWLGSTILALHLIAVLVGAIPAPHDYALDTTSRASAGDLRSSITSALDGALPTLVRWHRLAWALTDPVRGPVRQYLTLTGQFQKWNMFSNPATTQQYAEIRYHLTTRYGDIRVERQLVFPASRPGAWRLVGAYFDSFTDKAFANCFESYQTLAHRAAQRGRPIPVDDMRELLLPVIRNYAKRRIETGVPPGETLARVELWRGDAEAPTPGGTLPAERHERRHAVLEQRYGTLVEHESGAARREAGAMEREADITWRLWAAEDYR